MAIEKMKSFENLKIIDKNKMKPKKPIQPARPARPAKATQPTQPEKLAKATQPTRPAQSVPAVQPLKLVQWKTSPQQAPRPRTNHATGGFSIPSTSLFIKDYLDTTYQTDPSTSLANIAVSTVLYETILSYLTSVPYSLALPNPDPLKYHTPPGVLTIPLWLQTSQANSRLPTWNLTKSFLRDFKPCIDAADSLFRSFCPKEYAHMKRYHSHLVKEFRANEKRSPAPGMLRGMVSFGAGEYRTPFESLRVSVNTGVKMELVRGGKGGYRNAWVVVLFLGGWVGGEAGFAVQDVEGGKLEKVEIEGGDAWVLSGEEGRGCVFGLNGGHIGERVMVEFLVPVVGWTGVEER
ncbi:hypothetical protein VTL71DRAFT_14107 [Oculimacula yallundae]|uniref:Uncharacterized protein n=1 Tax=Oculimacula yallundae TaxID=86028 RepID=A0ABR4CJN9_9HELO